MMWIKGYNLGSWSSDYSEIQALLENALIRPP